MKLLKLCDISTSNGTQIRAKIDSSVVDEYALEMLGGAKFPPVVVFHDGSDYMLADGFHRVMAASRNGAETIAADVRKGTRSDALKYALGANSAHGLKRTNADKRRSVELALEEWPKLSDRQIAEICAVGAPLVGDTRAILNCNNVTVDQSRIGRDGKERKMPTRKVTADVASEPTSPPCPDEDEEPAHITQPALESDFKIEDIQVEPNVTEYYTRLESLVMDALGNATDKQLRSMSVFAHKIEKLINDELKRRTK